MYFQQDNSQYHRSHEIIGEGEKLRVTKQSRSYKIFLPFVLVIIASILLSVPLCQWMLLAYRPIDRGFTGCLLTIVCFLVFDIFSAWIFFRRKAHIVYRFKLRMFFASISALITILLSYMLLAAYNPVSLILLLYMTALCANLILNLLLNRHQPAHERPRIK